MSTPRTVSRSMNWDDTKHPISRYKITGITADDDGVWGHIAVKKGDRDILSFDINGSNVVLTRLPRVRQSTLTKFQKATAEWAEQVAPDTPLTNTVAAWVFATAEGLTPEQVRTRFSDRKRIKQIARAKKRLEEIEAEKQKVAEEAAKKQKAEDERKAKEKAEVDAKAKAEKAAAAAAAAAAAKAEKPADSKVEPAKPATRADAIKASISEAFKALKIGASRSRSLSNEGFIFFRKEHRMQMQTLQKIAQWTNEGALDVSDTRLLAVLHKLPVIWIHGVVQTQSPLRAESIEIVVPLPSDTETFDNMKASKPIRITFYHRIPKGEPNA